MIVKRAARRRVVDLLILTPKRRECCRSGAELVQFVPGMNETSMVPVWKRSRRMIVRVGLLLALMSAGHAQECFSGSEIDAPTARAVQAAAQQYFSMSAQGDVAGLKANALPDVAANFGGIESAVISDKQYFAEGQVTETRTFVLDATNSKTVWQRAEFYCGIYNSPDRVGFAIPNLPPGRYAITITKLSGKDPVTLTLILAEDGKGSWKLAGYYARRNSIGDHDGQWFLSRAREFKAKGQALNAWFYYLTAWDLLAPVDFMSTPELDKVTDEIQASRPADVPTANAPLELSAGGKTYKVSEIAAVAVGPDFDLRVKYETPDASNPTLASQENAAVMKALLAKYPEFRDAFVTLIARATDNAGHDYGTLTPMKDVK